ncbi:Extracellular metalloprotease [Diaporthe eres]|nr:Extracellular metalloprotease [Diaporthe eres]
MKFGTLLANFVGLYLVSQAAAREKCGSSDPEPEARRRGSAHHDMRVLNETYAPHGIQFTVADVSHSANDSWTTQARIRDKALALRRGGYDDLNLYLDTGLMTNAGSATGLPGTMPGGSGVPWVAGDNKGKTAAHEVGHWLGLFHVFDGFDCAGEGDLIDDTPATSVAAVGCPVRQDSCPDQPGLDPVHNYMDYASHDCITEFTPLQEERMYRSFNTLRRGK